MRSRLTRGLECETEEPGNRIRGADPLDTMNELQTSWATVLLSAKTGDVAELGHRRLPAEAAPFLVEYDLSPADGKAWKQDLAGRAWSMWRYRELLPVQRFDARVDLGAGGTPLVSARSIFDGCVDVWVKDESGNPTGSFKARGLSLAVNRARELGAPGVQLPSAGNAALAAAAYAAAAGLPCRVAMPSVTPTTVVTRCRLYGAEVLVGGSNLAESARELAEFSDGYWDLSTFKEPYRVEGKKTMGLEILEQLSWRPPACIVYPTGGGTGIVALHKAFQELQSLGILTEPFPRLVSVQMSGCAPLVKAHASGASRAEPWVDPSTKVWGLRVPSSVADFLILDALRSTGGTAISVEEDAVEAMQRRAARSCGLLVGPEGAAALLGLEKLLAQGWVKGNERVVVLQTGHPANYANGS